MKPMKPVALIILDGWGWREATTANAVALAQTPNFDRLWAESPHTLLTTSGLAVGLPDGVMGNSEVGHLNIGAGRIVYQDLTRINESIRRGEFATNPLLQTTFARATQGRGVLHVMGLVSDGGVHSHLEHLLAVLDAARSAGVPQVLVHCFTDGRDTSPNGGLEYLRRVEQRCTALGNAQIATIIGRYFAMDRDRRWDRTKQAFDAMVWGHGERWGNALPAIMDSYQQGITDEFITPKVICRSEVGTMQAADPILFLNFRGDRARQIVRALAEEDFAEFDRGGAPRFAHLTCMTRYHQDFPFPVIFPPQSLANLFGEVVSAHGLRQLRIAETEKYAHVTFFFNGGQEHAFGGEDRALIQSPKDVPTYDHKPEMSAHEVTDEAVKRIQTGAYDVVILNYANADMVGHTGILDAAVQAVETVDTCLGRVVAAIRARGGVALITADHGNAEEMATPEGKPHTAHTTNPVPCLMAGHPSSVTLREGGILADLAPTLLALLALPQPAEMTGRSLLSKA